MTQTELEALSIGDKVLCLADYYFEHDQPSKENIKLQIAKIYTISKMTASDGSQYNKGSISFEETDEMSCILIRVSEYLEKYVLVQNTPLSSEPVRKSYNRLNWINFDKT
jgi:protein associated with RNAse G/E